MSTENIFLLLLNPRSNNVELQKIIAKHMHDCYEIRQKTLLTFNIRKLSNCKFIWRVVDVQCIRHQIKYVWMNDTVVCLLRGVISALFHEYGKRPSWYEAFRMSATGAARMWAFSLRGQAGIPSGPGALRGFKKHWVIWYRRWCVCLIVCVNMHGIRRAKLTH